MPDGNWVKEHGNLHLKLTEGFHSWIHAHGMHTFEQARQHAQVNLSGLGRGLVMAGDDKSLNT
jgi:asparagine synthase (glutamine-hydrolysing)